MDGPWQKRFPAWVLEAWRLDRLPLFAVFLVEGSSSWCQVPCLQVEILWIEKFLQQFGWTPCDQGVKPCTAMRSNCCSTLLRVSQLPMCPGSSTSTLSKARLQIASAKWRPPEKGTEAWEHLQLGDLTPMP